MLLSKFGFIKQQSASQFQGSSSLSSRLGFLHNAGPNQAHRFRIQPTAALKLSDLIDVDTIRRALSMSSTSGGSHSAHSSSIGSSLRRYRRFLDEWDKGFMDAVEQPVGYWADVVYGEIPEDLEGTFFRNGPGRFTIGGRGIDHPYDGDGLVASLAFKNGKVYFRSRFVSTPELKAEEVAGEALFRGTFATQRRGGALANAGDLYVKNTSNTNVVFFGDTLLTLFEAGQPYKLDPKTLETLGIDTLGGALHMGLPFDVGSPTGNRLFSQLTRFAQHSAAPMAGAALPREMTEVGGDALTAHPSIDPSTGRLVTFSYRIRPILPSKPGQPPFATDVTFWELEKDASTSKYKQTYTLPGFAFLHDFAITERYYVIFQNPVTVDNAPYILGQAPAASCVRWVPGTPTMIHLIPRRHVEGIAPTACSFAAPPLFVFHHANAYETDNGRRIVIDSIHYNSLPAVGREALAHQSVDPEAAFTSRLRRVELDLETNIMRTRQAFDGYLEMPVVHPDVVGRKHRFVYGYHSLFEEPGIALARVDMEQGVVETWNPGPCRFCLEPRFIPRKNGKDRTTLWGHPGWREDDGWLIAQLFDSEKCSTEIVILDAADVGKGPVAVIALREPLPSALHACWTSSYYGPAEGGEEERMNVVPFKKKWGASQVRGYGDKRPSITPNVKQ